jgi:heptosyltransferase-2
LSRQVERIFVKGTNWIGDVFLSLPAVYSLSRIFPGATIDIALKRPLGDLVRGVPVIDGVLDYDARLGGELDLIGRMRRARYDLGVVFPRSLHAALLVFLGGSRTRLGYAADGRSPLLTMRVARTPEVRAVHQSEYYRHLVAALGDPGPPVVPRLSVGPDAAAWADRLLEDEGCADVPLFGINPGAAYGGAKRWLPERFAAAADGLARELGGKAIIFGGTGDLDAQELIVRDMATRPVLAAGKTTLTQLIALIDRCRLFITNDSGPMHIAAALGVPIVALFGPTNPVTTGPMGKAAIVRHELECSSCLKRECPTDHRCMELITTDEVVDAARTMLEEGGEPAAG